MSTNLTTCNKCHQTFSNKYTLATHQKNVNCVKESVNKIFMCKDCNSEFSSKQWLTNHLDICVEKRVNDEKRKFEEVSLLLQKHKDLILEKDTSLKQTKIELNTLQTKVSVLETQNKYLYDQLIQKAIIKKEELDEKEEDEKEELDEKEEEIQEPGAITELVFTSPLFTAGKTLTVFNDDKNNPMFVAKDVAEMLGYVDTNQAIRDHVDNEDKIRWSEYTGNRQLTHSQKDKGGVSFEGPVNSTGPSKDKNIQPHTMIINESGVYSLILRSKLESAKHFKRWVTSEVLPSIRKTGEYKVNQELKNKDKRIKELEKKYLKRQARTQYTEQHVIYIVATKHQQEQGIYKIGMTDNLVDRLSLYNTGESFDVIYYKGCQNSNHMKLVEDLVFYKLDELGCRQEPNHERFVLPKGKDISYFIDIIEKCVLF